MLQCWASEREFYIGGSTLLCQFIEPVTFVRCAYSILCPLGSGALSGGKKVMRISYSRFLSREKTFANCLKKNFHGKKRSRICSNPVHHVH